jgi:6-pyruvoyl-tetrahydropterin synthase
MEIKMSSKASEMKEYIDEITDKLDEKYAKHFRECKLRSPSKSNLQNYMHARAGSVLEVSHPTLTQDSQSMMQRRLKSRATIDV